MLPLSDTQPVMPAATSGTAPAQAAAFCPLPLFTDSSVLAVSASSLPPTPGEPLGWGASCG